MATSVHETLIIVSKMPSVQLSLDSWTTSTGSLGNMSSNQIIRHHSLDLAPTLSMHLSKWPSSFN